MTTVINTPPSNQGSGLGVTVGVVLVVVILLGLFFVYGLPAVGGGNAGGNDLNVNVDLPTGGTGGSGAVE